MIIIASDESGLLLLPRRHVFAATRPVMSFLPTGTDNTGHIPRGSWTKLDKTWRDNITTQGTVSVRGIVPAAGWWTRLSGLAVW